MAASRELRTQTDVAVWLATGLALRRVTPSSGGSDDSAAARAEADEQALGLALGACANELPALPPPGVVADIAALLTGARLPLPRPLAAAPALRAAIRAYDDDVLARLVSNPRFDDVLAAYAHLPPGERPAAVAVVVGAICERAAFAGTSVSPAALRRALAAPREERETAGRTELLGGEHAERLAEAYDRLARAARQTRALVDQREVFAIDHLSVLRDLGGRMTADHVAAAAEAIARALPRRLPATRLARGAAATHLADESLYPAGGFAAITPGGATGNLENLVTSELAYMEDGPEPDLFTVRYVEGELLYYTRDDSVFRRHRRVIAIALGADLDDARVKDREAPWQRLILALGLFVAAIHWLTEQLGDDGIAIRVAFPPGQLTEEREIFALLMSGEIQRGLVVVDEAMPDAVVAAAAEQSGTAVADAIYVSLGPALGPPLALPAGLRVLHLNLSGAAPTVTAIGATAPAPESDVWTAWCDAAEDVLRWLV